jgi:hypothetical protein
VADYQPKALLWPVPYCPDEATFEQVAAFVERGGALYLSGDVGYDEQRRPTQAARWARLGLPERTPRDPFSVPEEDWTQEPLRATVGEGKVFFVPYPLEMRPFVVRHDSAVPHDATHVANYEPQAVYRAFLELAGVKRIDMAPDRPDLHAFSLPTRGRPGLRAVQL